MNGPGGGGTKQPVGAGGARGPTFGQPLDPEGSGAPPALLKLIQFLQRRGKNTPGLFRTLPKEDSRTDVDSLRKAVMVVKEHLDVESYTKSPFIVAEVMRQYLTALPEPLLTYDLYDSFLIALTFVELEDRLDYWRLLLASLPSGFKATAERTLHLLHLLHSHATGQFPANGNYAVNLAPVFASIFLRPRSVFPHMTNDTRLVCEVVQHIIEHVSTLFEPSLLSTVQNTPRRPNVAPVPTPLKLSTLPRSLRSSPPSSPASVPLSASTFTTPSLSHPVPERKRKATVMPRATPVPTEQAQPQQKPTESTKDAQESLPCPDAASEVHSEAIKQNDNHSEEPISTSAEDAPLADLPDDTSNDKSPLEEGLSRHSSLEKPPSDTERGEDEEGDGSDTQEDVNVDVDVGDEILSKGIDEQIVRIERACEDLSTHLYDAAMNFDKARDTTKSLRLLCSDVTKFFERAGLELPGGDLSDDEIVPEDEQDEGRLLMLITQIKHMLSQVQAYTQLLSDAYDQSEEETQKRRLIGSCVIKVADRLHSLAHPHQIALP